MDNKFLTCLSGGLNLQDQSFRARRMDFYGLRLEYSLEGSSIFFAWKDHVEAVLEDNGLKESIDNDILKLGSVDA